MKKALHRRTLASFDARSVMLFAALALGAAAASQAQGTAAGAATQPRFGPADTHAPTAVSPSTPSAAAQAGPVVGIGPHAPETAPAARLGAAAIAAAFERADTNRDGQLSAQEAATLPAIGQRFRALDTDRNGSLSRSEFEKGAAS